MHKFKPYWIVSALFLFCKVFDEVCLATIGFNFESDLQKFIATKIFLENQKFMLCENEICLKGFPTTIDEKDKHRTKQVKRF